MNLEVIAGIWLGLAVKISVSFNLKHNIFYRLLVLTYLEKL